MNRHDREALSRAARQDFQQQRILRDKRKKRPMTPQERMEMLERVISELKCKLAGYMDPQAIALTERVIAQAEKELEGLKPKAEGVGE